MLSWARPPSPEINNISFAKLWRLNIDSLLVESLARVVGIVIYYFLYKVSGFCMFGYLNNNQTLLSLDFKNKYDLLEYNSNSSTL